MKSLHKLISILILILAGNGFIIVLRDEYVFQKEHALLACIALAIYAWEDIWS